LSKKLVASHKIPSSKNLTIQNGIESPDMCGYKRWEVGISNKYLNLNSYVGYCKAQFEQEQRKYVVIKARGCAIENALKVVQLVRENIGGLHSYTSFGMQLTLDRTYARPAAPTSEWGLGYKLKTKDRFIENRDELDKALATAGDRVVAAVEVILSKIPLFEQGHPGHQEVNPKVQPILIGPNAIKTKSNSRVLDHITSKRTLNYDFFDPSEQAMNQHLAKQRINPPQE
jgi:hypothetical protein